MYLQCSVIGKISLLAIHEQLYLNLALEYILPEKEGMTHDTLANQDV